MNSIIETIQFYYPDTQAIYLFGSYSTEYERPESDVDIAVLLPVLTAKSAGSLTLSDCWSKLAALTGREVDVINLRQVNTVFQHEIIHHGQIIFNADEYATAEFEMLTMSFYQKLNEERKEILEEVMKTKRILDI